MTLVLIIAGLVLLLAGTGWFAAAATVGWILLISGLVITAIQVGWFFYVKSQFDHRM